VLMDLQMPEMDGFQATAKIRSDPRFAKLPIIAMTAHATMEERQRCLDAGMNDHISKPIDPDAMYATLERWVKPAARATEPAAAPRPERGPAPAEMPSIEGIDAAEGLARVAGNARLYRSLLEQFAAKQASTAAEIETALRAGDRRTAERLAHTVKGVAGNLAMRPVHEASAVLEKLLREGGDPRAALSELSSRMRVQVTAIRVALGAPVEPAVAAASLPFDSTAARVAIARMRKLLVDSDGEAAEAFPALAGALGGAVGQARLDALADAIQGFDFETALSKLEAIAGECGAESEANA